MHHPKGLGNELHLSAQRSCADLHPGCEKIQMEIQGVVSI